MPYIRIMECYTVIKRKELIHTTKWMNLKCAERKDLHKKENILYNSTYKNNRK